jgi:uncharacterized protein involved in outer membrane biogenesis
MTSAMQASTSSSSPRRHRGWRIAGAVLLLIVIAFGVCEWLRWPFLVKPVEKMLSDTLQRQVQLQEEGSTQRAGVRFLGSLRVWAPVVQIAAPSWSQQPFFLRAEQAQLRMRYGDLWQARNGGALDIDRLVADQLVVHAERQKDGQASWTFGDPNKKPPPDSDRDMAIPNVRDLGVREGDLTYQDAILKADIRGKVSLAEGTSSANESDITKRGLRASAEGTYGNATLNATLQAAGAMPLLTTGDDAPSTPITLSLKAGRAAYAFDGTVADVLHFKNMKGSISATGPSLAAAGEPFGVTLPTTGAFAIKGLLSKEGNLYRFSTENTTVGDSKLRAALSYDMRGAKPLLAGRVSSPRFQLADLLPSVAGEPAAAVAPPVTGKGKAAPRASKVIPDKEFDLPSLRAMNANVLFAFDRAELGSAFAMPLDPLKAHLLLTDGKLRIQDIDARTADGRVAGLVALDGSSDVALWEADLKWSGVKLERWLKQDRGDGKPAYIAGRLIGRAELKGKGRSTAQILGSLNGTVFAALRNGSMSHLVVEGAGLDIAQALGVFFTGDNALPLQCGVVDMVAENGVLKPRAAVLDTKDSTIWIDGSLSLVNETMDLRAIVAPKDFSPLALRTPVRVQGSFGEPSISLQKDKLARKLASSVLLGLINPLAAVIPLIDPGNGDKQDEADACPAVLERARQAAGVKG